MGDRYLLKLLVVSAQAGLYYRKPHADLLRLWTCKLMATKPFKLVAVALANKLARIAFALTRSQSPYTITERNPA
jgi:transposase